MRRELAALERKAEVLEAVEAVSPESKVAQRLVREQASLEEQLRLLRHVEAEAAAEAEAARAVSRPFPSWNRSTLTEIYLC
eukprot:COSAG01_NODE_22007_length_876_cov_0.998713_1_plen_80_part_10